MSPLMLIRILLCIAAFGLVAPAIAQNRGEQRSKALIAAETSAERARGQLVLPEFAALADKASESVSVSLEPSLLGMACRFLSAEDPEEAQAKKLCTSLRGVYVRHYTFETDYAYPRADIERVRRQLSAPGWNRIVEARSKKENTDVDVFVLIEGEKAQGLSIIASQPREFTIVNIVGSIDLEQLHQLEGQFGVPDLDIEPGRNTPAPNKGPEKK
jgi:hypothetical protein